MSMTPNELLVIILIPSIILVYIIAQILWTRRNNRRRPKQRQLAGETIQSAVQNLARRSLKPPANADPIVEALERELNELKKEKEND